MQMVTTLKEVVVVAICSFSLVQSTYSLRPQPSIARGMRDIAYSRVVDTAVDLGQYAVGEGIVRTGESIARRLGISEATLERLEAGAALVAACVLGAVLRHSEHNRRAPIYVAAQNAMNQGMRNSVHTVNPVVAAVQDYPQQGHYTHSQDHLHGGHFHRRHNHGFLGGMWGRRGCRR